MNSICIKCKLRYFYGYTWSRCIATAAKIVLMATIMSCSAINISFADSQEIRVAVGDAQPPWVMHGNGGGIILDILQETLGPYGYDIVPKFVPLGRRHELFNNGEVDVVIDVNDNVFSAKYSQGHLSSTAYAYENVFIALEKNDYRFKSISDFKDIRLIAWQNAKEMLGSDYREMAEKNKQYREIADQAIQVKMLYGRNIVIQMDWNIFLYHRNKLSQDSRFNFHEPIDIFRLLSRNECSFLFKKESLRDIFNDRLKELKANGKYEVIFKKYTPK